MPGCSSSVSASVRMFCRIPIATPATKATGMLLRLAIAAAVIPATSSVVKLRVFVGSRGFWMGRSRTPESPARTLESAHAPAATPDAFTPSSWESRLDSTTARIFRPTDVHLKTAIKANDDHHGQDRVGDLPAVYRVTRRVEDRRSGVEPEKADVVTGRRTEDDRNGLRYRDQQPERGDEFHRRRRGRNVPEEEAVERQTHERGHDEHRDQEAEPLFQCGPYWLSRSKANADTNACAPNAILKTPVARKVITSPTAMSAYSQPVGIPGNA